MLLVLCRIEQPVLLCTHHKSSDQLVFIVHSGIVAFTFIHGYYYGTAKGVYRNNGILQGNIMHVMLQTTT
jgi:uncharacterized protein YaaW (UPF0174 family)